MRIPFDASFLGTFGRCRDETQPFRCILSDLNLILNVKMLKIVIVTDLDIHINHD